MAGRPRESVLYRRFPGALWSVPCRDYERISDVLPAIRSADLLGAEATQPGTMWVSPAGASGTISSGPRGVTTRSWKFVVSGSFTLTGRGVGLAGELEGEIGKPLVAGVLRNPDGERTKPSEVHVELVLRPDDDPPESLPLFVPDLVADDAPAGSVLSAS